MGQGRIRLGSFSPRGAMMRIDELPVILRQTGSRIVENWNTHHRR